MAEHSFPFDANYIDGQWDRVFNSEKDRQRYGGLVGNGVFVNPANNLQVIQKTGMNIMIKPGKAWINGGFYINDADKQLTIDNADSVLNRIDTVVLKFDLSAREITLQVKKGSPSSVAQAPNLTQTKNTFELGLANIYIGFGVGKITQANITDTRQDNSRCGIVKGLVEQINTTDLFAQYTTAFNEWFNSVKNQLGSDVAGNLQNQINDLNARKQESTDSRLTTSSKKVYEAINSLAGSNRIRPTLSTNGIDRGVNFRLMENRMVFVRFYLEHNGAGFSSGSFVGEIKETKNRPATETRIDCQVLLYSGEYVPAILLIKTSGRMEIAFTSPGTAKYITANSFYFLALEREIINNVD